MPRHSNSKKNIKGGNCSSASDCGSQIYGDASSQQPVPGTNIITMKPIVG